MPVYTFKCKRCQKTIEKIQNFEESNPICNCIKEGVSMNRLMPMTGKPRFNGSGFYETDYKQKLTKPLDKANGSKDKKND